MSDEFSWDDSDNVVAKPRDGVAVYVNPNNDIVIRTTAEGWHGGDAWVAIPREAAEKTAKAILLILAGEQ